MENKISKETIIRTILLGITLLNTLLTHNGMNPLPFSEDQLYQGISDIAMVASTLWAWWKNNDFTKNARKAGAYLKELKKGN